MLDKKLNPYDLRRWQGDSYKLLVSSIATGYDSGLRRRLIKYYAQNSNIRAKELVGTQKERLINWQLVMIIRALLVTLAIMITMTFAATWKNHLVSRAVLQPDLTEPEASMWEDETMSALKHDDLRLTTQDQLFEDDMPLEPTKAEEMVTNWTHGAEKHYLQWKSTLANFFTQGT
ncbi:hypothetical protein EDD22DRAFT_849090 [Suillus occidentalis]|nr:hypothetical protein EDD22DRAFT_849090 [Suillus occidentalis]